jgi:hypothetical protein
VGNLVGTGEGITVGIDGDGVGSKEGREVGLRIGTLVGKDDGGKVGIAVGASEGSNVGKGEGD